MLSRIIQRFVPVAGLALVLVSCLVHEGKPMETYNIRQPATLRMFEGGERMEYVVVGYRLLPTLQSENFSGTMIIEWQKDSIFNPTENIAVNVLRATTTLDILGAETDTVQFFLQSPPGSIDAGSLHLVAVQGAGKDDLYWVETDSSGLSPEPVKVQWSPFATDTYTVDSESHPYSFDLYSNCSPGGCLNRIGSFSLDGNYINVMNDGQYEEFVETQFGNFNTYRQVFSGSFYSTDTMTASIDPRLSCVVGAKGQAYLRESFYNLHPEVGIVRMVNTCVVGGMTVEFNATLRDTNIVVNLDPTP